MRLWSLHPKYLDKAGLLSLWRESLLAQKVLAGQTKGYVKHPQLTRFKNHPEPQKAIGNYLSGVWRESNNRGYNFDKSKIGDHGRAKKIEVTHEQLSYEFELLKRKLRIRDPRRYKKMPLIKRFESHPLFRIIPGGIQEWEKKKVLKD